MPRFFALGFTMFLNVVGFVVGLALISAFNAALLQPAIPVFACAMSLVFRVEKFHWMKVVGSVLAVIGSIMVCVFSADGMTAGGGELFGTVLGNVIMIIQTLGMAAYLVIQKPLTQKYKTESPFAVTFWSYSMACLFAGLMTLVVYPCLDAVPPSGAGSDVAIICARMVPSIFTQSTDNATGTNITNSYFLDSAGTVIYHRSGNGASSIWMLPGLESWGALAYAIVFATFTTYTIITVANKRTAPSLVAAFMTIQPVSTFVFSVFFLNAKYDWKSLPFYMVLVGGVIVATGVIITSFGQWQERVRIRKDEFEKVQREELREKLLAGPRYSKSRLNYVYA